MSVLSALWNAVTLAFSMTWAILGADSRLQPVRCRAGGGPRAGDHRLIGDHSPKSLLTAAGLGAASSSCS